MFLHKNLKNNIDSNRVIYYYDFEDLLLQADDIYLIGEYNSKIVSDELDKKIPNYKKRMEDCWNRIKKERFSTITTELEFAFHKINITFVRINLDFDYTKFCFYLAEIISKKNNFGIYFFNDNNWEDKVVKNILLHILFFQRISNKYTCIKYFSKKKVELDNIKLKKYKYVQG